MGRAKLTDYDVIVVGSGPAGISTAMHLTKLTPSIRNRIMILERSCHPREKPCGGGLSPYAESWLKRLNISLPSICSQTDSTHFIYDSDEYTEHVFVGDGFRTVSRKEFDAILCDTARSLDIQICQNEPVLSFSLENEGVSLETAKRNLTTQILVGADGATSIIRRQICRSMGIPPNRTVCPTLLFMEPLTKFNRDKPSESRAVIDFSCALQHGARGYAWSFPVVVRGQRWLNAGVVGFNIPQSKKHSLVSILIEFLATKGIPADKKRFAGHPIRWFHPASVFSANRVILVGDAAGIDPLWGEGISFSLGYGQVAADCIARALDSGDFSFASYKEELLEHEIGQELMRRLELADKLYRCERIENLRDHLLSVILHGQI
jgi:flavin-dependent dehydrogenase